MKCIAIQSYGPATRLQMMEMPRPEVGPHQILIRVKAASVNPVDWKLRSGMVRWIVPLKFPAILGFDVAGEIESVGAELSGKWNVGEQVCGYAPSPPGGCYAEFVAIDAEHVLRKPENLSPIEGASIPLAASTAWQALFDLCSLRPGDDVLINGASGGVGIFATQIAKIHHAKVTAVCSGRNEGLVRELGADEVINYHEVDFTQQKQKYDVIFDAVGKASFRDCCRVLDRYGRFATTLPSVETVAYSVFSKLQRRSCGMVLASSRKKDLQAIYGLAEQGKLRTIIDEVFPLDRAADAHRKSEDGHAVGKIVLQVAD
ncbi:NAD(P)-dependent alcohol dehydrogenase [Blastopirellula sp. JC732]|uniref:NAD(P)-dependent alcohol dehydrogenase n=1 Tax=Blastopirellula sediminis TaxID=2894196 RepID=A0A9X1MKH3_9BACT|nr:NAD(P)-dependent alcohol dehydrogenase [Blastopirellula sediminis]MCC9608747.1 NAD(P)-dependent alcohol dehydrogenase [Blastopirellula sediminis]MCC9628476.1 NAD(P)-dependent alcohol dehydrogenase [Blastopirellula sediminis]